MTEPMRRSLRYDADGSATEDVRPVPHWDTPCDMDHEFCESSVLHIRARCPTGCPQFQDGSWMNRGWCQGPHPGLTNGEGEAGRVKDWLEASFALNRFR